jgi:hypothetical protein
MEEVLRGLGQYFSVLVFQGREDVIDADILENVLGDQCSGIHE